MGDTMGKNLSDVPPYFMRSSPESTESSFKKPMLGIDTGYCTPVAAIIINLIIFN